MTDLDGRGEHDARATVHGGPPAAVADGAGVQWTRSAPRRRGPDGHRGRASRRVRMGPFPYRRQFVRRPALVPDGAVRRRLGGLYAEIPAIRPCRTGASVTSGKPDPRPRRTHRSLFLRQGAALQVHTTAVWGHARTGDRRHTSGPVSSATALTTECTGLRWTYTARPAWMGEVLRSSFVPFRKRCQAQFLLLHRPAYNARMWLTPPPPHTQCGCAFTQPQER